MSTDLGAIFSIKDQPQAYQPILLVEILQIDGTILRLSTHDFTEDTDHRAVTTIVGVQSAGDSLPQRSFRYDGHEYLPLITNQDIAATQALSEDGIDITPTVTLRIADPNQEIFYNYELMSMVGFKGAHMTMRLVLVDMAAWEASLDPEIGTFIPGYSSDTIGVFLGQCDPATQENDEETTISAVSKLNMKRILIPKMGVSKRCPWILPQRFTVTSVDGTTTVIDQWAGQKTITPSGGSPSTTSISGANSVDSDFYPCGFDNGATIGNQIFPTDMTPEDWVGNVDHCQYTKSGCEKLGMYSVDSLGRQSGRYGGFQFDIAANNLMDWKGKNFIEGVQQEGVNNPQIAKYSSYIPMVYGTAWIECVVMNVLGDPNSTRGEAIVCVGEVGNIIQVVVNDVMIPPAQFRYTGYSDADIQTLINRYLASLGVVPSSPFISQFIPDTTLTPIAFVWNTTPILVDTALPHKLKTGDRIYIKDVKSDGVHGNNSANGTWTVVVNTATQVALIGSSANQDWTGGGWLSRQLPGDPSFATKRWNIINWGERTGRPTTDAPFNGRGDPYGSCCAFLWVVPSSVAQSNTSPRVRALVDGPKIPVFFGADPSPSDYVLTGAPYNENPVWQILDLLVKGTWTYDQIDLASFVTAAAICDEQIDYVDQFGLTKQHARFACSFTINAQKNLSDILRSLRQACGAILIPNMDNGKLKILIKGDIARQQPNPMPGSNNNSAITSGTSTGGTGYLAYDFTEADILRNGPKTTFKISQTSIQQTPNKIKVSFQDKENAYQQDGLTIIEDYDYVNVGEVVTQLQVDGPNTYDHVQRIVTTTLAEYHRGNPAATSHGTIQIAFDTTYKACHLNIGDIIRVTFAQKGIVDQLFRVTSKQPSTNYEGLHITANWHYDYWYDDLFGQGLYQGSGTLGMTNSRRHPYPWQPWQEQPDNTDPLYQPLPDTDFNFSVAQHYERNADGSDTAVISVTGKMPINQFASKIRRPIVPPQGGYSLTGGNFEGPNIFYVSVCGIDSEDKYTTGSLPVRIDIAQETSTASLSVDRIICDEDTVKLAIFVGTSVETMTFHKEVTLGSRADVEIEVDDWKIKTWGLPDPMVQKLKMKGKTVIHSGVFGAAITSVEVHTGVDTGEIAVGATWAVDEWVSDPPRQCIVASNVSLTDRPGLTPIWNFEIIGNTTLGFIVTPAPVGVVVGDAFIMRMQPEIDPMDAATATTRIVDSRWRNKLNEFRQPVDIVDIVDNGDGSITIETEEPHEFVGGRLIYIIEVSGVKAGFNGFYSSPTINDETHFTLSAINPTEGYFSGGITAEQGDGMEPDAEIGNMIRVIGGPGEGETAVIKSNDRTSFTLAQPLKRAVAADSIIIVEEPSWRYNQESTVLQNGQPGNEMSVNLPVKNAEGDVVLVTGVTVDAKGTECPEELNPYREVYIIGAPGEIFVRDWLAQFIIPGNLVVEDDAMDNHIRVRCATGEFLELIDVSVTAKEAPVGHYAEFDIQVSYDGGLAWMTILSSKIQLPDGSTSASFSQTKLSVTQLHRDDLLRLDVTDVGLGVLGSKITIDLKGKIWK